MNKAAKAIPALKPVTFRYKKEIDPARISQFGLVAEEVEKIKLDLVVHDKEKGKPYSVRYDQMKRDVAKRVSQTASHSGRVKVHGCKTGGERGKTRSDHRAPAKAN